MWLRTSSRISCIAVKLHTYRGYPNLTIEFNGVIIIKLKSIKNTYRIVCIL
ncbi:hypothetical protein GCM10022323_20010 [Asaccharospora irregularis DSM 2635]